MSCRRHIGKSTHRIMSHLDQILEFPSRFSPENTFLFVFTPQPGKGFLSRGWPSGEPRCDKDAMSLSMCLEVEQSQCASLVVPMYPVRSFFLALFSCTQIFKMDSGIDVQMAGSEDGGQSQLQHINVYQAAKNQEATKARPDAQRRLRTRRDQ